MSPLRVATWNLREGVPVDGSGSGLDDIADTAARTLRRHAADMVALQEVAFDAQGNAPLLDRIQQRIGLRHAATFRLSPSAFDPEMDSGVAILSRWPLSEVECNRFPNPSLSAEVDGRTIGTYDKGFLAARVTGLDRRITFISLHMFPFYLFNSHPLDAAFVKAWAAIGDTVCDTSDTVIVCGDFNTDDRNVALNMCSRPLSRAIRGHETYRGISVDDILFSNDLRLADGPFLDENFSDHKACITSLRFL